MLGLRLIAICFFAVVVVTVPRKQFCARMEACSTESNYIGPQGLKGEPGAAGTFDYSPLEAMKTELKELKDIVAKANLTTSPGGSTSPAGTACTSLQYENRCFLLFTDEKMSYENAAARCQQSSSTLANIQSKQLYDKLLIYIRPLIPGDSILIWLGGTFDPNVSSNYVTWNDGSRTDVSGMWFPSDGFYHFPSTVANEGSYAADYVKVNLDVKSDETNANQGLGNDPASREYHQLCEYSM